MEAVSARYRAARHPEYFRRDRNVAEHQDDPVHGPDKFHVAAAPAHWLGYRQCRKRVRDDIGEQGGRVLARDFGVVAEPFTLVGSQSAERFDTRTTRRRKTKRRFRRLAVRIERGTHRGATPLD